jgi:hypothetical protein
LISLSFSKTLDFLLRACILRFKDCPLCGADIQGIEPDDELQGLVDRFIDGHARIKRSHAAGDGEAASDKTKVIYEDVSMERGAFLVQQAMRVSYQINSHKLLTLSFFYL